MNEFGDALKRYRDRVGKSIPAVAIDAAIDRVYLYRLEAQDTDWLNRPFDGGPPRQPSRDLVIRLALVLDLTLDECDELLLRAGYAPLNVGKRIDAGNKTRYSDS